MTEPLTLARLNASSHKDFAALLAGTYEHSPWVVERAWPRGPFMSLAQLKRALVEVVQEAGRDEQLALLQRPPELAGKAMARGHADARVDATSRRKAGLAACSAAERAAIARLNKAYRDRFGFPFLLAVRGPRGDGLTKAQIIATFERRLEQHPDFEFAEALRNVHRVAELRLDDRFAAPPTLGQQAWDCAELLARHSDPGFAENGQLTVTYLTDAHRACAAQLVRWMKECGFDDVSIDAVGNVVGVYRAASAGAKALLTGSHFDTVRNGGKYDGRLGIFVPMVCVRELARAGRRLPFALELVAFAEEEGQRYKATFLGSGALLGQFDARWLEQADAAGVTMKRSHAPRRPAGLGARDRQAQARPARLPRLRRGPHRAGAGAQRARPAARRRHLDQRRRALRRRGARHGQPRRHDADGEPARRRRRGRRARASTSSSAPARSRTWSARWACSRCRTARPTSFPAAAASPRHPRHHRRGARRLRRRRARRGERDLRAARRAARARGDDARRRRAERRPRGRRAGSAPSPPPACRCTACRAAPATTR